MFVHCWDPFWTVLCVVYCFKVLGYLQRAVCPASTVMVWPVRAVRVSVIVVNVFAISSTVVVLLSVVDWFISLKCSGWFAHSFWVRGVMAVPGVTVLTLMLCLPSDVARVLASESIPAFAAEYGWSPIPCVPFIELVNVRVLFGVCRR